MRKTKVRKQFDNEYHDLLGELFGQAVQKSSFDFVLTILRCDGMFIGHWDTLEESKETLQDFSTILEEAIRKKNEKLALKIGLMMYCHAVEMNEVHTILANLLKILGGKHFSVRPLWDERILKRKTIDYVPPSATKKFKLLKKLAENAGQSQFSQAINDIFSDKIRNSFSHSDYCVDLDKEEYHYTQGGPAQSIPLSDVNEKIIRCFAFYENFFQILESYHYAFKDKPRYYKWDGHEVFELLRNKGGRLYGFNIYHSNGTKSTFERHYNKVLTVNLGFETEGISVQKGNLDELRPGWFVDGKEIKDFDELNHASK